MPDASAAPVARDARPNDRSRDRSREQERARYRPGTRQARRLVGNRKDRLAFLEQLARHGDPAIVADQLGLPLLVLFRHRDADPQFAAEWQAAVNYAWERVESRVLASLLGQVDPAGDTRAGPIDTRLALAILARRDRPANQKGTMGARDGAATARLRAEMRALAGIAEA